jgi:hypothetical protein
MDEARAKWGDGRQPSCTCDYCTGKKNPREWCARCGAVRLRDDQDGFEDLDVCDDCEAAVRVLYADAETDEAACPGGLQESNAEDRRACDHPATDKSRPQ